MIPIYSLILPELIVALTACALFILGASKATAARRSAPVIALLALLGAAILSAVGAPGTTDAGDAYGSFKVTDMSTMLRVLACLVSVMFVLLAWPSDKTATSNRSISFGGEACEFFALLLLSVTGMMVVADSNDLATLFLGIELASIPTYVMVTMSRPTEVAQEAGVKYFFLGAAAAAIMLFGISYLYGTTGETNFDKLREHFNGLRADNLPVPKLVLLAATLMIVGFCFKLAAAPLHFYAGDVYQGAATPVTALLSFVPKTTGVIAIVKLLFILGGQSFAVPPEIGKLIWWLAVVTMTVGNVLGLLQLNVKRVLAYSSVAHSGYLLMGLAVMSGLDEGGSRSSALQALLFYLIAYGVMNAAAFGVLMLLPSRSDTPSTTAETYDDLAGTARANPMLGLAMAVSCFSLIGMPLTIGFFGKLYLVRAALEAGASQWMVWLVVITMLNAAVSAAYYLKIVATMWSRADAGPLPHGTVRPAEKSLPISLAVGFSVFVTLVFGVALPVVDAVAIQLKQVANALPH